MFVQKQDMTKLRNANTKKPKAKNFASEVAENQTKAQIQGLLKYLEESNLLQLYSPEIRPNLRDSGLFETQNKQ